MYFKKLELVGFKSFMDKTTLHFEPGITAVVGPNGSGKSNVFDSIRWVLGEQSVKALRGCCMEDVIFNGTDLKEPLGMAEVTLTFDNQMRFFNLDHEEVAITRRIFRSGESEYLLNKSSVRLKDILDLIMGTGIGQESYALVAQGKIDLILSSKPEDRRIIFDEASGITKYKSQKKEALRKLEETEQNLARVNDIIAEVKRSIDSLERQAAKARRYKEAFEELKNREIDLSLLQKNNLLLQKEEIIRQLDGLKAGENRILNIIKVQELNIQSHQAELKALEDNAAEVKEQIIILDNLLLKNGERIGFNRERIKELDIDQGNLATQAEKTQSRLILDEEKLNRAKEEYSGIKQAIEEKAGILKDTESQLDDFNSSIKLSLDRIAETKKKIMGLVSESSHARNEIAQNSSQQQIYLARIRRLELEKAKVNEEKAAAEGNLGSVRQELENLEKDFSDLRLKLDNLKNESAQETISLNSINTDLENLEKEKLTWLSKKEFIEKLKAQYEDIGESMDAVVYLDKLPREKINGLVVKVKSVEDADSAGGGLNIKLRGEAKPFDLDTQKISERLKEIEEKIAALKNARSAKEMRLAGLNKTSLDLGQDLRSCEMNLSNKKTFYQGILEQFGKIKEEQELIIVELGDVQKESASQAEKLSLLESRGLELDNKQREADSLIHREQDNVVSKSSLKEKALVGIAKIKAEIEALNKRFGSDEATLKILEDAYRQDQEALLSLKAQIGEAGEKQESLRLEIKDLESQTEEAQQKKQAHGIRLNEVEVKYEEISSASGEAVKKIESEKKQMDGLKNKLYELQMQDKELDFKILNIRERVLQAYKIDLEGMANVTRQIDEGALSGQIQGLKEKLDSLGNVNLLAIEEYDELKKRYDFLIQQQNDLVSAKESLHEAILKINRTTKKMFLETFEKVAAEFRNYFRLLFNGGDAQVFLIDEQDPLESGIEIICRPPGKKLQNVLLLSGGEKSLSAIALIFAIFKIKPSPFCVLDEIDAALDEANVDRFSRLLQEFAKESQFIVITHNKKTIANADVMYGITMQESGVSKIVSVRFAKDKAQEKDKEPEPAMA